jgi:hypothetical protein
LVISMTSPAWLPQAAPSASTLREQIWRQTPTAPVMPASPPGRSRQPRQRYLNLGDFTVDLRPRQPGMRGVVITEDAPVTTASSAPAELVGPRRQRHTASGLVGGRYDRRSWVLTGQHHH